MPPWLFVTPSSRGIGLSLSRLLLRRTTLPIVATTRSSPSSLVESILRAEPPPPSQEEADCVQPESSFHEEAPRDVEKRLHCLNLDVCNEDSIKAAAEECKHLFGKGKDAAGAESWLHLAFAIPGILTPEKSPAQLEIGDVRRQFDTNVIGPLILLKHFSPFLPRKSTPVSLTPEQTGNIIPPSHATWAAMSARVGSISDNSLGGWYSYRSSKAALNQAVKTFDNYLRTASGEKATAVALHPGTVKTGLSKEFWGNVKKEKLFSAEYAAERLVQVVRERGEEGRGRVWDWKGEEIRP